jgi:hypothetical protein
VNGRRREVQEAIEQERTAMQTEQAEGEDTGELVEFEHQRPPEDAVASFRADEQAEDDGCTQQEVGNEARGAADKPRHLAEVGAALAEGLQDRGADEERREAGGASLYEPRDFFARGTTVAGATVLAGAGVAADAPLCVLDVMLRFVAGVSAAAGAATRLSVVPASALAGPGAPAK